MSAYAVSEQKRTTAEKWVTQTLATEQRPITFREVARQVGCHIHSAKNLLLHYQASHPDVVATYSLSGPLLSTSALGHTAVSATQDTPASQSLAHMSATQKLRIVDMDQMSDDERNSEADEEEQRQEEALESEVEQNAKEDWDMEDAEPEVARWGVVIVKSGDLDEKKKLFVQDKACVHIYALSPAPIKDPAQLLSSSTLLRQHGSYRDAKLYGTISGEELGAAPTAMSDGALNFTKPKAEIKDKKEIVKKEASIEKKPSISQATAKDSPSQLSRKDSQSSKPFAKNKRRIVISDDEDEASSSTVENKLSAKTSLEPTSSMVRAADQAAMEAMMSMDVDDFEVGEVVRKPEAPKSATDPKDKKRKRKQVKKSKVEMDERGYMVTKDYYTEVSCSGSDTDVEPIPAPTKATASKRSTTAPIKPTSKPVSREASGASSTSDTKPKPPPKGTGNKLQRGQSTLAGFFKKK